MRASPEHEEKQGMQCYQYLAATVAVANAVERTPGIQHRLPLSLIADWMAASSSAPGNTACPTGSPYLPGLP